MSEHTANLIWQGMKHARKAQALLRGEWSAEYPEGERYVEVAGLTLVNASEAEECSQCEGHGRYWVDLDNGNQMTELPPGAESWEYYREDCDACGCIGWRRVKDGVLQPVGT